MTRELGSKLKALELEFTAAERICEGIDRAVSQLRANVPPHLATAAQISVERIRRPFFEKINALRQKIQQAQSISKIDFHFINDRRAAIDLAKNFAPHLVRESDPDFLDDEGWAKFASAMAAALPEWEAEAERIHKEMNEALAAAKSELLDVYLVV